MTIKNVDAERRLDQLVGVDLSGYTITSWFEVSVPEGKHELPKYYDDHDLATSVAIRGDVDLKDLSVRGYHVLMMKDQDPAGSIYGQLLTDKPNCTAWLSNRQEAIEYVRKKFELPEAAKKILGIK